MNEQYFNDALRDIYAAFGKKFPDEAICKAIFKRVYNLPDAFMDFACDRLEDEEKMPANIGRYLYRDLWPEFLERNPAMKSSQSEYTRCPKCKHDMAGYREIWGQDGESHIIRCICGNAPNPKKERIYTDEELVRWGWLLENPIEFDISKIPVRWRRCIGHNEEMRPAHRQVLEDMGDYEVF